MTPDPQTQRWDDEAIDRALASSLSVEPSPAFRARVAARVATEPRPASAHWWLVWSGAAAAAALLAFMAVMSGHREPAQPTSRSVAQGSASASRGATVETPDAPADVQTPAARLSRRAPLPARRAGSRPSVDRAGAARFDPREREAFARFLSFTTTGLLPEPAPLAHVPAELDVLVSPIVIPAIDVAPIDVSGPEEGEPKP